MVVVRKHRNRLYLVSKDNIICHNLEDGTDKLVSVPEPVIPDNLTVGQIEVLKKEVRTITSLEFSKTGKYSVIATESKQVLVFNENFEIVKSFIAKRIPSKVCFTHVDDIVVADKTGDVYLYKLDSEEGPTLLLGHLSVVLDVILSKCGKYIITCDRDEKIRVSHYPNCYNIASFCLGHTEFVTNMCFIGNILVSASGDGTIRFWDYTRGAQLYIIDTKLNIDKELLNNFIDEMNKEKVEVATLPITDLQVYEGNCVSVIAVFIYKSNTIQLYKFDSKTMSHHFLMKWQSAEEFCFYLCSHMYVLSSKLYMYSYDSGDLLKQDLNELDTIFEKYKHLISFENCNIATMYKRHYDNVSEYLERKKQRIEGK